MGIRSSKHHHAASTLLLKPAMEGNLSEIKRLVGIYIADHSTTTQLASYINSTDAASSGGNAAIHGAVFGGHLDILKFLIESCRCCNGSNENNDGGDDNNSSAVAVAVDLTIKNGLGCSPLWIAAGYDRIECLQYLIHQLQVCSSMSNIDQLKDAILEPNSTGDTPFMAAVSKGHIGVCKVLLKAAHYDEKNESSSSSNSDNYDETTLDVASIIMDMKCKLLRTANNSGDTPLKVAVATGQSEELISLLLHEDELVDEWMTTKHAATTTTTANSDDIQSKCINRKNEAGLSPLIVACERNLPSIVELLLKHDADISIQDGKGRNPLAVAAFCGCDDVVDFLLNKAKNNNDDDDDDNVTAITTCLLNGTDDNGCTPLWLAARTGNLSMVKVLMDAGADAMIKNNDDMTPYDVAVKFKKDKVVEWFEEREEEK